MPGATRKIVFSLILVMKIQNFLKLKLFSSLVIQDLTVIISMCEFVQACKHGNRSYPVKK